MPEIKITGKLFERREQRLLGTIVRNNYEKLYQNSLLPYFQNRLPGHYKKTIEHKFTGNGLDTSMTVFSNAEGIEAIEGGRKPGKMPPPNVLLEWVKRKGVGAKAFSVKTRKPLVVGQRRTFNRKEGKLRTKRESLANRQKGIAFAIGLMIKREGLPRNTAFPPSHKLYAFRDMAKVNKAQIDAAKNQIGKDVADYFNS